MREHIIANLSYEPETGIIRWVKTRGPGIAGAVAGVITDHGYIRIRTYGRLLYAHRIAWLIKTGEWPPFGMQIDHINGIRADNRWSNLRLSTHSENLQNMKSHRGGRPVGVHWCNTKLRWIARRPRFYLGVDHGHKKYVGSFFSIEEARLALESLSSSTTLT